MMNRRNILLGLVVLGGALVPTVATAALPVNVCFPSDASIAVYDWTGISNNSTSSLLYLDCSTADGPSLQDGFGVNYIDDTPGNITCNAKLVDGPIIRWSGAAQTSSSDDNIPRNFTWDGPNLVPGFPYVSCSLPVRSGTSYSTITAISQW